MKKVPGLTSGISEPKAVDDFLLTLEHPMLATLKHLREFMLRIHPTIGEGIFWNSPTFYYTGPMPPFDPKEYKRYLVGTNLYQQGTLRLIFLRGAAVKDPNGILEGDYKDGRRLISLKGMDDLKNKEAGITNIIKQLLEMMNQ